VFPSSYLYSKEIMLLLPLVAMRQLKPKHSLIRQTHFSKAMALVGIAIESKVTINSTRMTPES